MATFSYTVGPDTGLSSTDRITSGDANHALVISGTGVKFGDPITVSYINPTTNKTVVLKTKVDSSGNWSVTANGLVDGDYAFTIVAGGKTKASVISPTWTMDNTTPSASTIDLAAESDTGASSIDNLTSDNTPTLTGTAEANTTISIFDGTTLLGTIAANGSGAWNFITAPLSDGTHNLTAKATDQAGNLSAASSALAVTIDPLAPSITSSGGSAASPAFFVDENTTGPVGTLTASDPESQPLTWSLGTRADSFRFAINSTTGELSLTEPQDFESTENGADNLMLVDVLVSDGANTTTQEVWVGVNDVNEAPEITSSGGSAASPAFFVDENTTGPVGTLTASDPESQPLTWSLGTRADSFRFAINSTTGELSLTEPQDFESTENGADNLMLVDVLVSDGANTTTQEVWVGVNDVNDTII